MRILTTLAILMASCPVAAQSRYESRQPTYRYDSSEHDQGGGSRYYSGQSEHYSTPRRPSWERRNERYRNSRSWYDGKGLYDRERWDWYRK